MCFRNLLRYESAIWQLLRPVTPQFDALSRHGIGAVPSASFSMKAG
jgi:hypothetical protein